MWNSLKRSLEQQNQLKVVRISSSMGSVQSRVPQLWRLHTNWALKSMNDTAVLCVFIAVRRIDLTVMSQKCIILMKLGLFTDDIKLQFINVKEKWYCWYQVPYILAFFLPSRSGGWLICGSVNLHMRREISEWQMDRWRLQHVFASR